MTDDERQADSDAYRTDGGVAATEEAVDYLETEVNILKPSTPFMRDHLRVIWGTFIAWVLVVWGPLAATYAAPETMTQTMPVLEFPLHYFLVAFGAPTGALLLAAVYARQRDKLDNKYGIDPTEVVEDNRSEQTAAADGGVDE